MKDTDRVFIDAFQGLVGRYVSQQPSAVRNHTAKDEWQLTTAYLQCPWMVGIDAEQKHVYHIKLFTAVVLDAQLDLTGGIVVGFTYCRCV